MNKEQARETLKGYLPEYLMKYGSVDVNTSLLRCYNEQCSKEHGMSYDAGLHQEVCPDCGAHYDIFDFIRINNGLADNGEAFIKACDMYGIQIDENSEELNSPCSTDTEPTGSQPEQSNEQDKQDRSEYLTICISALNGEDRRGMEYLQKHGITEAGIKKFKLGFDPEFSFGGVRQPAIIIPNGYSYTARSINSEAERFNCYSQTEGSPLFNLEALTENKPVLIVENELDAVSCGELEMSAVSIGSADNVSQLLRYFKEHEEVRPKYPLHVSMDKDAAGDRASRELVNGLNGMGIPAHNVDVSGDYKNVSEALCIDRESFRSSLEQVSKHAKPVEENKRDRESYLRSSGLGRMQSFRRKAERNRYIAPVRTGFPKLDETLGGGLFSGLYIIGAISSLGKSAFALQIADNIAKNDGKDVLFFALEMSPEELMARSISRETYEGVNEEDSPEEVARTTREILNGQNYDDFSEEAKRAIEEAYASYEEYGEHIFFINKKVTHSEEGTQDTNINTVDDIREAVQHHVNVMNCTPVVIVDYLQLLGSSSGNGAGRLTVEENVVALKKLSRDFNTPVLVISSLNRASYDKEIAFEAFRESSSIEYSCDLLIGLQFERPEDTEGEEAGKGKKGKAKFDINEAKRKDVRDLEAVILKNRNGVTGGKCKFSFNAKYNRFEEVSAIV